MQEINLINSVSIINLNQLNLLYVMIISLAIMERNYKLAHFSSCYLLLTISDLLQYSIRIRVAVLHLSTFYMYVTLQ